MIITFGAIFVDALLTIHLGKIPVHRKEINHLVINELFTVLKIFLKEDPCALHSYHYYNVCSLCQEL